MQNIICFLKEWQTLVGALLGTCIPIAVALIIYPIRKRLEKKKQHKETLRLIEIYTSQIINDLHNILKDWICFIDKLKKESIKEFNGQVSVFLTNRPFSVPILNNTKLTQERTYDTVLHNFLLNMNRWVRLFNASLAEKQRSYSELQEEAKSQIAYARKYQDSNFKQVMSNYRKILSHYTEVTEKDLCMSIRNGVEVATIVKESANIILNSNFGVKGWAYRFTKKYRDYKKLKKLSIDNFLLFQNTVAQRFQNNFLENLELFLKVTQEQKKKNIKVRDGNNNFENEIKEKVLILFNITEEERKILEL